VALGISRLHKETLKLGKYIVAEDELAAQDDITRQILNDVGIADKYRRRPCY